MNPNGSLARRLAFYYDALQQPHSSHDADVSDGDVSDPMMGGNTTDEPSPRSTRS